MPAIYTPSHAWIKKLLLAVVVFIVLGIIFRLFNPSKYPEQAILHNNFDDSVSTFSGLTFSGSQPNIPNNLPTATGKYSQPNSQEVLETFSSVFNLSPHETIPNLYVGSGFELSIFADNTYYQLQNIGRSRPEPTDLFPTEQAIRLAEDVVAELTPESSRPTLLRSNITYYLDQLHPEISAPQNANLISLPFAYQIADLPVLVDQDLNIHMRVWVDSNLQLAQIEYIPGVIETNSTRSFNTISVYEALANIQEGNASIVSVNYIGMTPPTTDQIVAGSLSEASVQYRLEQESGTVVPYYSFYGTVTNEVGESFEAIIITPAIETAFD